MDYPKRLSIEELESTDNDYRYNLPIWETIDDLVVGGSRIRAKASTYLDMIPGENPEVYKARLKKFTYDSVIGESIGELSRKFTTGSIVVDGLPTASIFKDFWDKFRNESDNSERSSEILLAVKIFISLLTYGRVYAHIDQNGASTGSLQQDLANEVIPYINIYHPSAVIKQGKGWYKLRFVEKVDQPFSSKEVSTVNWYFIDDEKIAIYSINCRLTKDGNIDAIWDGNTFVGFNPKEFTVALTRLTDHNFGTCPIICEILEPSLWLADKALLKQLEHLRELNSKHSMNTLLYIQRSFKPRSSTQDDLEFITEAADSGIESGNPYILDVDSFNFNEPTGSASTTLSSSLQEITSIIKSYFGLKGGETTKGALERSGASKEMDFISIRDILNAYGVIIIPLLNKLYHIVSTSIGYAGEVNLTGLTNFQVDILSDDIDNAIKVQEIETQISPTALALFYGRISVQLAGSTTPENKILIGEEVEKIFLAATKFLDDPTSDETKPVNDKEQP
jgi:hypothetical protein